MRFALTAFAAQGREIRLDEDRIEGYRHFINKIWNAARFALMHVADCDSVKERILADRAELSLAHRWILSRTNETVREVRLALDEYRFNDVASLSYQFIWREFCDWYLEWIKADLFSSDTEAKEQAQGVLLEVLETILKLVHPLIPFVTEEIWSTLPGKREMLVTSAYPVVDSRRQDREAEEEMEILMGVISGIRTIRSEAEVHPSARIDVVILCPNKKNAVLIDKFSAVLSDITRLAKLTVSSEMDKPADAATHIFGDIEIFVPLKGLIDIDAELAKLAREKKKIDGKLQQIAGKLTNENFLAKAPEAVVAKVKREQAELNTMLEKIVEAKQRFEGMR